MNSDSPVGWVRISEAFSARGTFRIHPELCSPQEVHFPSPHAEQYPLACTYICSTCKRTAEEVRAPATPARRGIHIMLGRSRARAGAASSSGALARAAGDAHRG